MTQTTSEISPANVLDAAREALARAQAAPSKVDLRVLQRFEKKLRHTEKALTHEPRPSGQKDALRDVLARAEKSAANARTRSKDQEKALELLRAEVDRRETSKGSAGREKEELLGSLAHDTATLSAKLQALIEAKPQKEAKPAKKEEKPAKKTGAISTKPSTKAAKGAPAKAKTPEKPSKKRKGR